MGPERLSSLMLVGEFGSLGTYTNYGSYWELHLTLRSMVHSRFPEHVLQVMACRSGSKGDLDDGGGHVVWNQRIKFL